MSWGGLPFVDADDLALADDVAGDGGEEIGPGQAGLQPEIRVERVDDEMIVMRLAGWRRRTAVDRPPEPRDPLNRTGESGRHRNRRIDRHPLGQPFRVRRNV